VELKTLPVLAQLRLAKATPNPNLVGTPPSPMPAESPKTSLSRPQSCGLGSAGGFPLGGDSSVPQSEKPLRRYSRVVESLANDPEFIKGRFHIGWFITTAVDTEVDRVNIKVLYTYLESPSTQINISIL
jgi:hypothetical protein